MVVVSLRILSYLLEHIRPRRLNQGLVRAVARRCGRRLLCARAGEQPHFPMLPPTAILLRGTFKPGLRISRSIAIGEERRLRVAGRIENALNMTTVTQDKFAL